MKDLRDEWAMVILPAIMLRHKEPGYDDVSAIVESYRLADHACGIRGATFKEPPAQSERQSIPQQAAVQNGKSIKP